MMTRMCGRAKMRVGLIFMVGVLILPQVMWASTYYSALTGQDEQSCLVATNILTPKRTVAEGLKCLTQPGDTLVLREGTYQEALAFTQDKEDLLAETSWELPITIKPHADEHVVLNPAAGEAVIHISNPHIRYLHLQGFHINATHSTTGIRIEGEHQVHLDTITIMGASGPGVQVMADPTSSPTDHRIFLTNMDIHHNGQQGVVAEGSSLVIQNSQIHDNAGGGILLTGKTAHGSSSPRIWNNRLWNNGVTQGGWGIQVQTTTPTVVYGNVLKQHTNGLSIIGNGTIAHLIAHNTLLGPGQQGILVTGSSEGLWLQNNISVGHLNDLLSSETGKGNISHNLLAEAGLIDGLQGNGQLLADSPAVDAGVPLNDLLAFTDNNELTDIVGHPRPNGEGWDIGAYEGSPMLIPPPIAAFLVSPITGVPPVAVTFLDQSTGKVDRWEWDFGDGTGSLEQNPTHEYLRSGIYTVWLTVTGPGGSDRVKQTEFLTVQGMTPFQAVFSATPTTGTAPLTIQVKNESFGESGGWFWDFGDGTTSTARHPTHTYSRPGVYTLQLRVREFQGMTEQQALPQRILVTPPLGATIFNDPLTAETLTHWKAVDEGMWQGPSQWMAREGVLSQLSNIWSPPADPIDLPKLGTTLWYPPGDIWQNYRMTVDIRSDDDDALGIIFRYQDPNNYYRFSWDAERGLRRLIKRVAGTFHLLAEDRIPYEPHHTYRLRLDAFGPHVLISINEQLLFGGLVVDQSHAKGSVGFYSWFNNHSQFANLTVTELVAP